MWKYRKITPDKTDLLNIYHVVSIRSEKVGVIQDGSLSQSPIWWPVRMFEAQFEKIPSN